MKRDDIVLQAPGFACTRADLGKCATAFARRLQARGTRVLATFLDNGPAWVVADLAALMAGIVHVPLPTSFLPAQVRHALQAADADTLLVEAPQAAAWPEAPCEDLQVAAAACTLLALPAQTVALPAGTCKITFTSGSTAPRTGVCLREEGLQATALGLGRALAPLRIGRHLCVLPLPLLLENLAGLLAPLAHGATVVVPPLHEVGFLPSGDFDVEVFHAALEHWEPHSVILLLPMLRAWTDWLQATGRRAPPSLRIATVEGAAGDPALLLAARACGIPAYEGYGMAEGGSLQTLNLPGADLPGSVGRPLPHARLRIAPDGEIQVAGALMAGYLRDASAVPEWWPTGDVGSIDPHGFLHVEGCRSKALVTDFGDKVSPRLDQAALRSANGHA